MIEKTPLRIRGKTFYRFLCEKCLCAAPWMRHPGLAVCEAVDDGLVLDSATDFTFCKDCGPQGQV